MNSKKYVVQWSSVILSAPNWGNVSEHETFDAALAALEEEKSCDAVPDLYQYRIVFVQTVITESIVYPESELCV
jgi:hypothetical protein